MTVAVPGALTAVSSFPLLRLGAPPAGQRQLQFCVLSVLFHEHFCWFGFVGPDAE